MGAGFRLEQIDRPCAVQCDNLAAQPTLGLLMAAEYPIRMFGDTLQAQGAVGFSRRKRLGMFLAARECAPRRDDTVKLVAAEAETPQVIDLVRIDGKVGCGANCLCGGRHRRILL
ncbi:hypothetical protein MESS4_510221 [Mesorhizobium sp. STM 4661]|nr:hypothetical protein MESS4_510221 [Mesorhizobium sp. STM 4661]